MTPRHFGLVVDDKIAVRRGVEEAGVDSFQVRRLHTRGATARGGRHPPSWRGWASRPGKTDALTGYPY